MILATLACVSLLLLGLRLTWRSTKRFPPQRHVVVLLLHLFAALLHLLLPLLLLPRRRALALPELPLFQQKSALRFAA